MFSTIVVGTDGSSDANKALQVSIDLAKGSPGCSVHVVSANHPLSGAELRSIAAELPKEMSSLLHAHMEADRILDSARSACRVAGVEAECHEVDADPTDALLEIAGREGADLLVVGSRGEGLVKRAMHGSVSTKVIHLAPCSVLVVKSDE